MALFEDLKPCPFCGGKASLFVIDGVKVKCLDCNMGTPTYSDLYNKTPMAINMAIKQWNKRVKESEDKG